MRAIRSVTIITLQGTGGVHVGQTINGLRVHEIKDTSGEWAEYLAVDEDGGVIKCIQNCPVDVEYYDTETDGSSAWYDANF